MPQTWVTSDLHFGHDRLFIWGVRGCESLEEMEDKIIENWNDCVAPDDVVYILGDIVFGTDIDASLQKVAQLNGIKYLAIGNHDTDSKIQKYKESGLFEDIQFAYRAKVGKSIMFLSHYPTIVANPGDESRVYNVHGHTHSVQPLGEYANCYNVSPEAHACAPVLLSSIPGILRSQDRDCANCPYVLGCSLKKQRPFCEVANFTDKNKIEY